MTMETAFIGMCVFFGQVVVWSVGTLRMVVTVQGETRLAFILGTLESLIWVLGTSAVLSRVQEVPFFGVCYALGFAFGCVVGIVFERRIALGNVLVRIISARKGAEIAAALMGTGYAITTVAGEGGEGPVTVQFVVCRRRDMPHVLTTARSVDPGIFHTVETVSGLALAPSPQRESRFFSRLRCFRRPAAV